MTTWLKSQKKDDLKPLCEAANIKFNSTQKKSDILEALEEALRDNRDALKSNPIFSNYYGTIRANSPAKLTKPVLASPAANSSTTAAAADDKKAVKSRRTTTAGSSSSTAAAASPNVSQTLPASTPASVKRMAQLIPLPSSPQAVTELVERQSAAVSRFTDKLLERTGAEDLATTARELASSVHGVTLFFILLEAFALQRVTLPWRHAFNLPVPFLGALRLNAPPAQPVSFPDFFVLLTATFWGPSLVWAGVTILAPLLVGWLFNISRAAAAPHGRRAVAKQSPVDPVAFNVARGLLTWLVFVQGYSALGFIDRGNVRVVDAALWGGANATILTSAVATLAGVYEAVLRKS